MRDNGHVVYCQKLLHTQGRVGRGIVVVREPITAAPRLFYFSVYYHVIFLTPSNKIVDSTVCPGGTIFLCTIQLASKKLINMNLTFNRTCKAFFGFGELGVFHWLDACFVSRS